MRFLERKSEKEEEVAGLLLRDRPAIRHGRAKVHYSSMACAEKLVYTTHRLSDITAPLRGIPTFILLPLIAKTDAVTRPLDHKHGSRDVGLVHACGGPAG